MANKITVEALQLNLAKKKLAEIEKQRERAIKHLFWYAEYVEKDNPQGLFFDRRYWHVVLITMLFDLAEENLLRFCTISMSPRCGKSYITTTAIARKIGMHPQTINMRNSYSAGLAVDVLSVAVREFIRNNKRFKELFPKVSISKNSGAKERWKVEGFDNFSYVASGVGGASSGIGSSGYLVLDDEYQGMSSAMSEATRRETELFLSSVHEARKEKDFRGLMPREFYVCTRWTDKDTIGKKKRFNQNYELDIYKYKNLVEQYFTNDGKESAMTDDQFEAIYEELKKDITSVIKDPDDWFVSLTIPALIKENDKFVSFSEPYKTTKEWNLIKKEKENRGEIYIWNSVYMQNPVDDAVKLFPNPKKFPMSTLFTLPKHNAVAYIDPAFGGGDFTAMAIAYMVNGYFYVVDVLYDRGKPEITKQRILQKLRLHKVKLIGGEGNGQGRPYLEDIRNEYNKTNACSFRILTHGVQTKQERVLLHSGNVNELCLFLDERNDEYSKFFNEVNSATINLDMDNDDAVDCMAGLMEIGSKIRDRDGLGASFSNW